MSSDLTVAVIGCGGHARGHFDMIAAEPRLQLVAVCDLDEERRSQAAEQHGPVPAFDDYRRMLDEVAVDVAHVVTMPGHLPPIVIDCLERGLHVSVEKAPGMTSEDTKRMAVAASAARGKAIVSFNRRYFPKVLAVRRLVQSHGGAVHVAGTYNKPTVKVGTPAMPGSPDPIICDAIHHVDIIRWLAGRGDTAAIPVAVHAEVADGDRPSAHRHNAVVRFDTGAIGVLMSHYAVGYRIQRAEAHAEDLSAYLDMTRGQTVELYEAQPGDDGQTRGELVESGLDLDAVGGPDYDEVRHFTDCILQDRQPWSHLDDAVHTMRLCEAIRSGHHGDLA
jgi:predicted dehydrogenase